MLQRILFNKSIPSDAAKNGQEAIDMVALNPAKYSLIFMDNMMPVMVTTPPNTSHATLLMVYSHRMG
jgi:CheY-like chemotaxis protein